MKLLSWNIQWGRGLDGRVDLARIAGEIRRIGDFDVICLQEVAV
ncbi:MAG: endonuclease, partial [Thiobacillaceae bacterium]|nr:endonuclease [Thiobacillaceae bacterium]